MTFVRRRSTASAGRRVTSSRRWTQGTGSVAGASPGRRGCRELWPVQVRAHQTVRRVVEQHVTRHRGRHQRVDPGWSADPNSIAMVASPMTPCLEEPQPQGWRSATDGSHGEDEQHGCAPACARRPSPLGQDHSTVQRVEPTGVVAGLDDLADGEDRPVVARVFATEFESRTPSSAGFHSSRCRPSVR